MRRNACLSLSCKTYFSYDATYLPKLALTLLEILTVAFSGSEMSNIYGHKCLFRQNYNQYQVHTGCESYDIHSQINQPHGRFGGNFILVSLYCLLHLCLLHSLHSLGYESLHLPLALPGFWLCGLVISLSLFFAVSPSPAVNVLLGSILASSLVALLSNCFSDQCGLGHPSSSSLSSSKSSSSHFPQSHLLLFF